MPMPDGARAPAAARAAPATPTLETRGLTLKAGGSTLLEDIDLSLPDDGITVIMGENGAGKSLLLKLLHGLVAPTAGSVLWHGEPLTAEVRRRQAMVFQKAVLLRRSVAANIDFVLRSRGRRDRGACQRLLDHVGLADRARQPARLLSGGEQQRLALARALATEPEVLFLDEPTASLDPASVVAIEAIVQTARTRGTKIVFVTHDIGQARRLAEDVVFLHRGRLAEHRPARAFFTRPSSEAARAYLDGRILL